MNRREMMKYFSGTALGAMVASTAGNSNAQPPKEKGGKKEKGPRDHRGPKERKPMKQYTNADFYKDGVFQEEVAFEAYFDMFQRMNYSLTDSLRGNPEFWVADFGLGDFERVGMGGIFFFNNKEFRYFGHDIYLLPNQMIPEHFHLAAEDMPAKHESWQVRHGSIFNFGKGGELTPNVEAMLPKSQLADNAITCFNFKEMHVGDQDVLTGIGDPHFMMGGSNGAIVTEYACWHSGKGLGFTNKKGKA